MTASTPDAHSAPYEADFAAATAQYGLPDGLLREVARQESGFDPNSKSSAGALGLMQFMPDTAAGLHVNPLDPTSAIDGAGKYLSQLNGEFGGDWALTLAAYNAGDGNVRKYGGIPPFPETQDYVRIIFGKLGWASKAAAAGVPPATAPGTTGSGSTATATPPATSTGSSSTGISSGWERVIVEGLLLLGGVGLVVAGVYQATTGRNAIKSAGSHAIDATKAAAGTAAKAAMA